jgi:hypothetical protein
MFYNKKKQIFFHVEYLVALLYTKQKLKCGTAKVRKFSLSDEINQS